MDFLRNQLFDQRTYSVPALLSLELQDQNRPLHCREKRGNEYLVALGLIESVYVAFCEQGRKIAYLTGQSYESPILTVSSDDSR